MGCGKKVIATLGALYKRREESWVGTIKESSKAC